jgi:hypothetical protein
MVQHSRASVARSGLSAEQERTWFAYMRVALRLNFEINRDLQAHSNLSHSDFHVLNALADSPDEHLSISDLAVADARATDVVLASGGRDELRRVTPRHAALTAASHAAWAIKWLPAW